MNRQKKIVQLSKFGVVLAIPFALWAYSSGPDAHKTAVSGTAETSCNACHGGTALNGGGGNVTITASNYTPGQKQTITIKITDSAARVYGFQATARLASDHTKPAGTFTPGAAQRVLCASTDVSDTGATRSGATCAASTPLEFIEHTSPQSSGAISFDWTPPSTDVGAIDFFVSANAANGNGGPSGDHIYTASATIQPAVSAVKPTVSSGGVINAFQFGGKAGVAPGSWIEIYGQNFTSVASQEWSGGDFNGVTAPTSLSSVSVTIAGKPAYLRFISPGQINAQVPDGIGTGPVQLVVTSNGVASDPQIVTASDTLPGLLAPFTSGGKTYVAAFEGATIVGSPGNAPVKPGDTVTLYGIGWGAVTPSVPAGNINSAANALTRKFGLRLQQIDVSGIQYQGLGPNFVGLYQFNVVIPSNVPDGDLTLDATLDGVSTGQALYLTVKK